MGILVQYQGAIGYNATGSVSLKGARRRYMENNSFGCTSTARSCCSNMAFPNLRGCSLLLGWCWPFWAGQWWNCPLSKSRCRSFQCFQCCFPCSFFPPPWTYWSLSIWIVQIELMICWFSFVTELKIPLHNTPIVWVEQKYTLGLCWQIEAPQESL